MVRLISKSDFPIERSIRQIILPLVILITAVAASILAIVYYSIEKADVEAKLSSEKHVSDILRDKRNQLATLAKDYGYWDDTIRNAFYTQDSDWIYRNLGRYLTDTFYISELLIVDEQNQPVLSLQDGEPLGQQNRLDIEGGLSELVELARQSGPIPVPVSTMLLVDGLPALVGASVLAAEQPGSVELPTPRPVLILAKRFDQLRLSQLSESFGLAELQLKQQESAQVLENPASIEIHALDQRLLGNLIWQPSQPGALVLGFIKTPLIITLALIALLSILIFSVFLQSTRRLADTHKMMSRLSSAIEQTNSAVLIGNRSGTLEYANSEFFKLFQPAADNTPVSKISALLPAEKFPRLYRALMSALNEQASWAGEFEHLTAQGTARWIHATITPIKEGERCSHVVCVATDISEMKQAFDEMAHLASHDALTGLVNRRLFSELLEQAMHLSKRDGSHYALLYLDLDRFKQINDTWGHTAGDQLLTTVATRLKENVRESDVIARIGGDEFVVLLHNIDNRSHVEQTTIGILRHLTQPIEIGGHPVNISASAGIALIPKDGLDPHVITKRADLALYQSKRHGGNAYHFFREDMEQNPLTDDYQI
ncbi:MAG: diguanylate cyclase [Halopseudomonas sp.]